MLQKAGKTSAALLLCARLGSKKKKAYVLFPMTLLMFIWTVSSFRLMANTTSVSQGDPCWPAAFPFLPKEGVEVFVTESKEMKRFWWEDLLLGFIWHVKGKGRKQVFFVFTSPWRGGIRHASSAAGCRGFEVAQAAWRHVAPGGVLWEDVGGLWDVLRPIPGPEVCFPAGLRGQMLGNVFSWVRGSRARGCRDVKV